MPYILRIKDGDHKGQYVGRKGIRSWDWKFQEDPNNARVFASEAGVKRFHGRVYEHGFNWKKASKEEEKAARLPYTDRYELVEINFNV
jgi:hypothetical protein